MIECLGIAGYRFRASRLGCGVWSPVLGFRV